MSRNMTWTLVSSLLKKKYNFTWSRLQLPAPRHLDCAQRGYASVGNITPGLDYHDQEIPTYQEFLDEHDHGRDKTVKTLMSLLDVTRAEAKAATREWLVLTDLSKYILRKNFETLRAAGAFKSLLRQNIYALADNTNNVQQKVAALQQLNLEINYAIPLLKLSAKELNLFVHTTTLDRKVLGDYGSRLEYLAAKLDCHVSLICKVVCSYRKLLTLNMVKIMRITELIEDMGMPTESILSDPRIYSSSVQHVAERMRRAKAADMVPLKSWVVRCDIALIEKAEKRKRDWNRLVGPSLTLEAYICKLMDCDFEDVVALIERDPSISTLNIVKLTDIIIFLRQCGYTIEDVYRVPRTLHTSLDKIKQKYETWVSHGLGTPVISTLTITPELFDAKLQKAIEEKGCNS